MERSSEIDSQFEAVREETAKDLNASIVGKYDIGIADAAVSKLQCVEALKGKSDVIHPGDPEILHWTALPSSFRESGLTRSSLLNAFAISGNHPGRRRVNGHRSEFLADESGLDRIAGDSRNPSNPATVGAPSSWVGAGSRTVEGGRE